MALGYQSALVLAKGTCATRTVPVPISQRSMVDVIKRWLHAGQSQPHTHGEEPQFRVRETKDWKSHAADLEVEMIRRGITLNLIDWSGGQAELPL